MADYGVREAWRKMGSCCLKYSLFAITVSLAAGVFIGIQIPLMPGQYLSSVLVYSAVLALPVLGLIWFESRRRDVREFSILWEAAVVTMVLAGFSIPVAVLGILLVGVTLPDYAGVERWLPDVDDRAVYELKALQRMILDLQLPEEVEEEAEAMIEEARDRGLMKGRSFDEILAGIIYITARDKRTPRTIDEIADVSGLSNRETGKAYRYVARELDRKIAPPSPSDYIPWFISKLDLSQEVEDGAERITQEAEKRSIISGKSPAGIAATAVYIAAHPLEPRSMKEVSDVLDVTTITVRERGRELVRELEIENPPENLVREEKEK